MEVAFDLPKKVPEEVALVAVTEDVEFLGVQLNTVRMVAPEKRQLDLTRSGTGIRLGEIEGGQRIRLIIEAAEPIHGLPLNVTYFSKKAQAEAAK